MNIGQLGLIADGDLHKMLSDHIGQAKTDEINLLSRQLSTQQRLDYGMANKFVGSDKLEDEVQTLVDELSPTARLTQH